MALANSEKNIDTGAGGSSDSFVRRVQEIRIGDKYQLVHKLGQGAFGQVYLGRDVDTGKEVAIKLEHCTSPLRLLANEIRAYQDLAGKTGIPRVYWDGELDEFKILVLELLGPSLQDLVLYCGGRFSLKTTLMLADQLLRRLEVLHAHHYVHKDISPRNFLLGTGHLGNVVYITDFGLTAYHGPRPGGSATPATYGRQDILGTDLIGTMAFASINAHEGGPESACDELEALGYLLVYLAKGKLPWQRRRGLVIGGLGDVSLHMVTMKVMTCAEELCEGLPAEFAQYMNYVRGLKERHRPDHRHLRRLFSNLFGRQGFENDNVFDWTRLEFLRLEAATEAAEGTRGSTAAVPSAISAKEAAASPA